MSLTTITLIGGGACGTAAFIELFLRLKLIGKHREVVINLIEQNSKVGPGLAFGTEVKGHMLNTAADLMGIHVLEPEHFSKWLSSHADDNPKEVFNSTEDENTYTTRRLYGDYLEQQFNYYRKVASEEGLNTNIIHDKVIGLTKSGSSWMIRFDKGDELQSDFVLLFPGSPQSTLYKHLNECDGYFSSPWVSKEMQSIKSNDSVAILGAGLSAIDAVMTLADNNHQGPITLYSPDGLLPRVQPKDDPDYRCSFLNMAVIHKLERKKRDRLTVKELFRLYKYDVEHLAEKQLEWKEFKREGLPAGELLKQDITDAEHGGDALLQVAYATREYSSDIWLRISEDQRLMFKKWFGTYWSITRHSMPLPNAKRLLKLLESGQLRVKFPVDKITFNDGSSEFSISCGTKVDHAHYVINAVGPASSMSDWQSPLIKQMLNDGIVCPCDAGGIRIDPETMQVIGRDSTPGSLYAAGHIANGTLLDVNAVWFNTRTVGRLCAHLARKLHYLRND